MKKSIFWSIFIIVFCAVFVIFSSVYPIAVIYKVALALASSLFVAYGLADKVAGSITTLSTQQVPDLLQGDNQNYINSLNSNTSLRDVLNETFNETKYSDNHKTDSSHIAGTEKVSGDSAKKISLVKLLNSLNIPHIYTLENEYSLGRWEYPTATELFKRAIENSIEIKEALKKFVRSCFNWAGIFITSEIANLHFLFAGGTGSGKSVALKLLMTQAFFRIGNGEKLNQRAIVYDPQLEYVSFLYSFLPQHTVKILNPFDERCWAWWVSKDITDLEQAEKLANIIVPQRPEVKEPFFTDAGRQLVYAVILSLMLTAEKSKKEGKDFDWSLYDIVRAFRTNEITKKILNAHEATKDFIEDYLERKNPDVQATIKNCVLPMAKFVKAWEGRPKISLRDWLKDDDGSVLVLSGAGSNSTGLETLNRILIEQFAEIVLTEPEPLTKPKYPSRTWLILDEFADLKIDALVEVLEKGRKKGICVALSFQNYLALKENYGENKASIIASQCSFKMFFNCDDEAAEWIAKNIGKVRYYEESFTNGTSHTYTTTENSSYTYSTGLGSNSGWSGGHYSSGSSNNSSDSHTTGTGSSTSDTTNSSVTVNIQERDVIMKEQLTDLPLTNPENGMTGYAKTPLMGGKVWKFHYNWNTLKPVADAKCESESNFADRRLKEDIYFQVPMPFSPEDLERLGINLDEETGNNEDEAKKKSKSRRDKLFEDFGVERDQ